TLAALVAAEARRQRQLSLARNRLRRAIALEQVALKPNPQNPTFLQALRDQTEYLAEAYLSLGDHPAAARVAARLPGIFRTRGQDYFLAAGFLTRCMALVENAAHLPEDRRQRTSFRYADQARRFLLRGITLGL